MIKLNAVILKLLCDNEYKYKDADIVMLSKVCSIIIGSNGTLFKWILSKEKLKPIYYVNFWSTINSFMITLFNVKIYFKNYNIFRIGF